MKALNLFIPISPKLVVQTAKKRGWLINESQIGSFREDFSSVGDELTSFAVADGVTQAVKRSNEYPIPSGAGAVAEVFCKAATKYFEENEERFNEDEIAKVFSSANNEIKEYNARQDRVKATPANWEHDLYCCAAAFAAIKGDKVFWGTMADCRVALFDASGKLKFISADGKLTGYGVLNGEEGALNYLQCGTLPIEKGDLLLVFSDGFAPYVGQEDFIKLCLSTPEWSDLDSEIRLYVHNFIKENKSKGDSYKFLYDNASEMSLIVVLNS